MFSDGFQDQFGGPSNRKFMLKRLKELFTVIHQKPMHEQKQLLENALDKWMGVDQSQIDDILLIGVKVKL